MVEVMTKIGGHIRRGFLALLLVLAVATGLYVAVALFGYHAQTTVTYTPKPATVKDELQPDWPTYGQAAVATKELGVVASHGKDSPHPTASTAKIITVLAVLQKKPLKIGESGPLITLTQHDVDKWAYYVAKNGSNTQVAVGEKISQYEAIQSVLLASSNNMADTLAVWAFGSLEAYHRYANEMVRQLGATQTTITDDASGLDPDTQSTAQDLARIALVALDEPVFAEVVAQPSATVPVAGDIINTNYLLRDTIDAVGVKTGETVEAGGNFVLATTQTVDGHTHRVVTVVMGAAVARDAIADSYKVYTSLKKGFAYATILPAGSEVAYYDEQRGFSSHRVLAVTSNSVAGWVWRGEPHQPEVTINALARNTRTCDVVGSVRYRERVTSVVAVRPSEQSPCVGLN